MQKETSAKAQKVKLALRAAFPMTIPVMVGYLFLGAAFGILLECNLWRSICWRRERAFCRWR